MQKSSPKRRLRKPQHQNRPGLESKMKPKPVYDYLNPKGCNKLHDKVALITGADSGIGRAVAVLFAKEGADVAVIYYNEHKDAEETKKAVENYGRKCLLISSDISKEKNCASAVAKVVKYFGRIDILVNNAATQYEAKGLEEIGSKHLLKTFQTNIFSFFWITRNSLSHMGKGGTIINTASVTAYRGSAGLIDYSTTKGAIVSFTRSLSSNLIDKGIRVNAVAPGPVWTPLIVSSFEPKKVSVFGSDSPMKRAGEPAEIAFSYLFLASNDSSYMTGQVLHPNGGEIVNG
jgi:NAD(P)-dependent dehydrogenase (short-subunit alcohol dehydrogenase family)